MKEGRLTGVADSASTSEKVSDKEIEMKKLGMLLMAFSLYLFI